MSHAGEHSANFAISSFSQDDLNPTGRLDFAQKFGTGRFRFSFSEIDSLFECSQLFGGRHTRNLYMVFFFNAVTRVGQPIGQFSVVGNQNQTFARLIEASDIVNSLFGLD